MESHPDFADARENRIEAASFDTIKNNNNKANHNGHS